MPLETQILRNGKPLELRWGGFHVAAMVCAAAWDSGIGPFENNVPPSEINYPTEPCPITPRNAFDLVSYGIIAATPLNSADYVLVGTHRFVDVTDGEILELQPGDVLQAWR